MMGTGLNRYPRSGCCAWAGLTGVHPGSKDLHGDRYPDADLLYCQWGIGYWLGSQNMYNLRFKRVGSRTERMDYMPQPHHWLAVWLWAYYLSSFGPQFSHLQTSCSVCVHICRLSKIISIKWLAKSQHKVKSQYLLANTYILAKNYTRIK